MTDQLIPEDRAKEFLIEVAKVINRLSLENYSNTPDWVLASYLLSALNNWNITTYHLNKWKEG